MVAQQQDTTAPRVGFGPNNRYSSKDMKLYEDTVNTGRPFGRFQDHPVGWSNGEDDELTVMRVLWDLYDAETDADRNVDLSMDGLSLGFQGVLNKIRNQPQNNQTPVAYTLSQLWNNLAFGLTVPQKAGYGELFELNNISPRIVGPGNIQVGPNDPIPTFEWVIPASHVNQAAVAQLLNEFRVRFYDHNFNELLVANVGLPPAGNNVAWTPTQQQWNQIPQAPGTVVYWVVEGSLLTGNYRTGWYSSQLSIFNALMA